MTKINNINNKSVVISTTITLEDYNYVKKQNLKFSRLLANAISVHRVAYNEGVDENYFNYLKRKIELLNDKYQKLNTFIEANNLTDEWLKLNN